LHSSSKPRKIAVTLDKTTMKKLIALTLLTVGLLSFGTMAQAADNQWNLTLSGNGNTTLGSDGGSVIGANVGLGHSGKLLLPIEGGVRQGFGYSTDGDNAVFETKLYLDVFPVKFNRFELGAGLNTGAIYGNLPVVYSAAPEGVVRFWLTEKAGVFARVEYPFDLGNQKLGDRLNYALGLTIRF
jgi:hypothetical protein